MRVNVSVRGASQYRVSCTVRDCERTCSFQKAFIVCHRTCSEHEDDATGLTKAVDVKGILRVICGAR